MPKPRSAPLLEHISLNPLMIASQSEGLFVSSVEHVVANDNVMASFNAATMSDDDDDFWPQPDSWMSDYRPYNVKDGVLQIPVMGVLLNRFPWQLGRWATGYKYIEMALKRGMEDNNVLAIAFVIDSPGGEVAGCFELCAKISAAAGDKPVRAFAADHAYSAAYAIAASCGTIIVTPSGGVGSVGVVTAHVEYSEYLKEMGIKVTFIFAGDHKVDGNSYEKLPKAVKDRIQKRIDKIYGVFCGHVSEGRNMDDADVRATNALTYDAEEAMEVGFADKIGSLEDEMVIYTTEAASEGENYMATQPNVTGQKPGTTSEGGIDQATYDRGIADAKAEGVTEGSASMLTRIKAIIQSDEGKERPTTATSFALNTSMTAAEAVAVLKDMPKEEATAAPAPKVEGKTEEGKNGAKAEGRNHFNERMDQTGGAGVESGDTGDDDDGDDSVKATNSILAAYGQHTGQTRKKKVA